jgi:C-terminal processing protease CtpA/Prc
MVRSLPALACFGLALAMSGCGDSFALGGGGSGAGSVADDDDEDGGTDGGGDTRDGGEDTGGGGGDGEVEDCTIQNQTDFVFNTMYERYLWWEDIPAVDPSQYDDARSLAIDMRYTALDRWTNVADKGISNAWSMGGKYVGYGFSTRRENGNVRIAVVDPGSPAYDAGVVRGDKIVSINGMTVAELDAGGLWGEAYGPNEPGIAADYVFEDLGGTTYAATLIRDWVDITAVPVHATFDSPEGKIGYVHFTKFVDPARAELDAAFDSFVAAGVERLIVDLRYNGGGSLSMTRHLNNLALGAGAEGEVSYALRHNDMMAEEWDRTYLFENLANSLAPEKVVFITSGSTLSASEAVINGIVPFVDSAIVGSTTGGKPVGTKSYEFCEQLLKPIGFRIINGVGNADYYDGFAPDCDATDDLLTPLGDPTEAMLAVALSVAADQGCPVTP